MNIEQIKNIVIAGSGVMGSSIAQVFAQYNFDVVIYDVSESQLEKSKELIALNQNVLIEKEILTPEQAQAVLRNLSFTTNKECFAKADLVSESIVEKLEVKHAFYEEIVKLCKEDCIITTNTSGLSIHKIAESVTLPQRFAGMHFVNPPHIVPLVEIIKCKETQDEVTEILWQLLENVNKKPIIVKKDIPGFILNRIQFAVLREALGIVESGAASLEDLDKVLHYGLGMRYACLGPFEIADLGGLDTFASISNYLFADLNNQKEGSALFNELVKQGKLGVKSGEGIYDYSNGKGEEVIKKRDENFLAIKKHIYDKE